MIGRRSAADRRFGDRTEGDCALRELPRGVHGTVAGVYQIRAAIPLEHDVPHHRRGEQRTTYRTCPTVPLIAFRFEGSGSRALRALARPSEPPRFGRRHCVGDCVRGRLIHRSVDAGGRTAGDASRARPGPRRRHRSRSPGTSLATAAARRPRSASGTRSTAPSASPPLGIHRRKMSADQPLVAHNAVPRLLIRRGSTAQLRQPTCHRPQLIPVQAVRDRCT